MDYTTKYFLGFLGQPAVIGGAFLIASLLIITASVLYNLPFLRIG